MYEPAGRGCRGPPAVDSMGVSSSPPTDASTPKYDRTGIDRTIPGKQYVHLGIDTHDMHHHYLGDERVVVVAANGYTRIEDHLRVQYHIQASSDRVEHVQPNLDVAALEGQWCAFVSRDRGWKTRTNRVYDVGPAVWEAVKD